MNTKTDSQFSATNSELSFIRGGPFYRIQRAVGLIRGNQWNLRRRIAVLIAIGWLPLLLITGLLNSGGLRSVLTDYRVYSRLLIAVPVLILGEILMDSRFRGVLDSIREAGLLDAPDTAYMDGVIAKIVRLRDAFLPELLILVLVIVRGATSYAALAEPATWLGEGAGADFRLTAAGWYAVLVSVPLWNFVLGLEIWRWLLWTFFVFKLSTRRLRLVATHPDQHGGLGFLGVSLEAFAPIGFASTLVIGANWRHAILRHGATLMDFKLPAIVLGTIIALVALGPLFLFIPRLMALRRRGAREYGVLGHLQSTEFHEKWILHRTGHEAEFLQAPETSRLSAFGQSYEKVERLKLVPADRSAIIVLAAAVVLPVLPVLLTKIPLAVVLKELFKALG
jgi:hypothetical protein